MVSAVDVVKGSMFCLTVPLKRKGTWGMTEMCCLRECNPISKASWPPIEYLDPLSGSNKRKRAWMMELFPAPVLPTIPIFSPWQMEKEMFLSTRGRPYLYLALKP